MKYRNLLMLLLMSILWGPSFLLIKVAVEEISPFAVAAFRILIGALALTAFLLIKGYGMPKNKQLWKHAAISGFFATGLPFTLICWGELYIDSALAAILNGLTPLFTVVIANFTIADDKLTIYKVGGAILGFIGLSVLVAPGLDEGMNASLWGIIAVVVASLSYGVGLVYARINLMNAPPLHAPVAQLLATSIYMVPFALLVGPSPVPFGDLSWLSLGAMAALGLFGTAFAYIVYFRLLSTAGPSYVSLVTYLMPIYGVVLGVFVLGESLSLEAFIGALVIMAGLGLANKGNSKKAPHKVAKPTPKSMATPCQLPNIQCMKAQGSAENSFAIRIR